MEEDGSGEVDTAAPLKSPQLERLLEFKVYKRRWFVLLVLCLLNLSNATLWLSFAPVASQTASFLDVSLAQVNWLSLVFMLVSIPLSLGTTWMLDALGLRITLILGSWLNMFGALVRFVGASLPQYGPQYGPNYRYPVVFLGQTLSALAQPLIIFTPTKLAALWFPEHQRATANMLASMSNPLGLLLANIVSPLLSDKYGSIPTITLAYTVPACLSCLLATAGVRSSTPPTAPSASAQSSHEPFIHGLKLLMRNRAYLTLMLCLGSGIASFTCFSSLLDQILCVQGYSDNFAGLCGALFIVWGIVGAGLLGVYVDKTKRFIEVTKINMSLSALACIAFSVVALMPQQQVAVALVCSLFGFFGFSVYPVAMELSVECSYPVGEATSAGLVFASGQVQSVVYMVLLQSLTTPLAPPPDSVCGDSPQSWRVALMLMGGLCALFTSAFVLFFNTRYRRLEAEEQARYGSKPSLVTTDQSPPAGLNQDPNQSPSTGLNQDPNQSPPAGLNQDPNQSSSTGLNQDPNQSPSTGLNQDPNQSPSTGLNQDPNQSPSTGLNQDPNQSSSTGLNQDPNQSPSTGLNQDPNQSPPTGLNQDPNQSPPTGLNQDPNQSSSTGLNQDPNQSPSTGLNQDPNQSSSTGLNQDPNQSPSTGLNQDPNQSPPAGLNQDPNQSPSTGLNQDPNQSPPTGLNQDTNQSPSTGLNQDPNQSPSTGLNQDPNQSPSTGLNQDPNPSTGLNQDPNQSSPAGLNQDPNHSPSTGLTQDPNHNPHTGQNQVRLDQW